MDDNLHYRIELEAMLVNKEMMLVANRTREICGESPAYGEEAFCELEQEILGLFRR